MDRTIIAPYRAEEKELSEKLYLKLQGLTLISRPTDEFRKCLSKEMFLKPNPQAFFHIMHYLFCLLDANEFKKRFYWPIVDKRGESTFRTSTLEYLKYLNEKHQLHWAANIKPYLVVMPGGMKFIKFLWEFVGFVIRELTRQREKQLASELDASGGATQVSELNLKRMRQQNMFFKEYASAYMKQVDHQVNTIREKRKLVLQQLQDLSKATGLSVTQLISQEFQTKFEAENRELFERNYVKPAKAITELERPLEELKEAVAKSQSKEAEVKYDKEKVRQSLRKIQALFPQLAMQDESFINPAGGADEAFNMNTLLSAFNAIQACVEDALVEAERKPCASEFFNAEMAALKMEFQQLEAQANDFHAAVSASMKRKAQEQQNCKTPIRTVAPADSSVTDLLMSKFVFTPPIRIETVDGANGANTRLPLIDDFHAKLHGPIGNFLAATRSTRKPRGADLSLDQSMNKSRIIGPKELLRTINKDKSKAPKQDWSVLGAKPKDRQHAFIGAIDDCFTPSAAKVCRQLDVTGGGNLLYTPLTPFNMNERTCIARNVSQDMGSSSATLLYSKKLTAVKKVQDASLNFQNLSTSPSGRLDALVAAEDTEVPKIEVNDEITISDKCDIEIRETYTLDISQTMLTPQKDRAVKKVQDTSMKLQQLGTSPSGRLDPLIAADEQPIANNSFGTETHNAEKENDAALANTKQTGDTKLPPPWRASIGDDDIFNISDSVLKDITM